MSVLIFLIVSYIALSVSLFFLFPKAGVEGWKGLVPGLNFAEWCKIIGRSPLWALWLLFPIVNIFIYAGMAVDMVRSFGKLKFFHSFLAVVAAPLFFFYLAFSKEEKYLGQTRALEQEYKDKMAAAAQKNNTKQLQRLEKNNPYRKGQVREWTEAIFFAVFAAAFIRMFLIEAYVIPTPSMEGSLLVGDFLFVSKAHYGIRTPKTIAMLPLIHNRIPWTNKPSYFTEPSLEFRRLPAIENIDRYDPVVFNYPEGDSIYYFPERTWSVHDYRRGMMFQESIDAVDKGRVKVTYRPIDKKDHYIKRCVAIPGDSLQIINGQLHINGAPAEKLKYKQQVYTVKLPPNTYLLGSNSGQEIRTTEDLLFTTKLEELGISNNPAIGDIRSIPDRYTWQLIMSESQKEAVKSLDTNIQITPYIHPPRPVFPHDPKITKGWSIDNYGPIYIPKAGVTVSISPDNIALYKRIIDIYEDNDLTIEGGKMYINGQEASEYTFQMDYYWMMGDNRHNSEDSRIWGFVPQDHVVGKPLFIWMSAKDGAITNGIRWGRIFSSADKR